MSLTNPQDRENVHPNSEQFVIRTKVRSVAIRALVDTGTSISFIAIRCANDIKPAPAREQSELDVVQGDDSVAESPATISVEEGIKGRGFPPRLQLLALPKGSTAL